MLQTQNWSQDPALSMDCKCNLFYAWLIYSIVFSCGIYSLTKPKPPFDLQPVVPFICAECPGDGKHLYITCNILPILALNCIDCAKIEDGPSHPFIPVVECPNNNCTNVNNKPIVKANTAALGNFWIFLGSDSWRSKMLNFVENLVREMWL